MEQTMPAGIDGENGRPVMTEAPGARLTHTFRAAPEQVFDAWTTPTLFATWWGGSAIEVPIDSVSLDARAGGTWTATMILGENMPEFHWRGEYLEVERPSRLVLTMTDEPGAEREVLTAEFAAVDGGTELRFSQTGGNISPEDYVHAADGWRRAFEALEALLRGAR
ncbi:SRPBCC domain-containing protein [Gordonia sp. 'Campus']|uniref:SRPBCC family protein n=1 Tax=Gordonia sp. 'Campus' TaxID=2915824 RepID=UPI001EE46F6F|nr:SRPBCC domain-containing protein [Gordonia sp. 'Campus']